MTTTRVFDEIIDLIATLPPKVLLDFHPSKKVQARVELLLEKNREGHLTEEEKAEMEKFLILEHIVRMAKAKALLKMQS